MKIIHEYPVRVFMNEHNGNKYYKLGLSKKDIDGKYINGYVDCRFRKDAKVDVDKKIYLQDCWLDFYVKDKITKPYVFVNKFDYVKDIIEQTKEATDPFKEFGEEIVIEEGELPF